MHGVFMTEKNACVLLLNLDCWTYAIVAINRHLQPVTKNRLFVIPGAQVATSLLQQRANDVRNNRVNWQSYLQ